MTATSDGRRQRRRETRRELIFESAATEFARVGYEKATLDSIGDRVGLSKASLYYYVDGKEELLVELLGRCIAEIEARAQLATDSDDPIERFRGLVRAHLTVATTTPEGRLLSENLDLLMSSEPAASLGRRYEQTLARILEDGVTAGTFRQLLPGPVMRMVFGALNSVPLWFDPDGTLTLDALIDSAVALLLTGIRETAA